MSALCEQRLGHQIKDMFVAIKAKTPRIGYKSGLETDDSGKKSRGEEMKLGKFNLKSLSVDELWALHEEVGTMLSEKITAEKRALEERLAKLNSGLMSGEATINRAASQGSERRAVRRKYPPVLPKYQNPNDPSETWAGRGKQPRWLVSQLKAGNKINDFLINRARHRPAAKRRPA
jgi:DNA-binding protein H-NS